MKIVSADGLMSSSDPKAVATWNAIGASMAEEQRAASARLRAEGVKLEHPDDGWVDRAENSIRPCYPPFDLSPQVGDLIALGWPWTGYRLVRCTRIERRTLLVESVRYFFEETGTRVEREATA